MKHVLKHTLAHIMSLHQIQYTKMTLFASQNADIA